jgi:Domain of unknown function (DUF4349)
MGMKTRTPAKTASSKTVTETACVALALFAAALGGCAERSAPSQVSHAAVAPAPPAASAAPVELALVKSGAGGSHAPAQGARQRAVSIHTSIAVDNIDESTRQVRAAAERLGGYVAEAAQSGEAASRSSHLDLRVPADAMGEFQNNLHAAGETRQYNETSEDVTDQLTDIGARLANARTQEKRILEIMSSKTANLSETLSAEGELARIREQIERMDAQQRNLSGRVRMVSVRVEFISNKVLAPTPERPEAWTEPGKNIAHAARTGLRGAAAIGVYSAMFLATVLPTALPLALAGYLLFLWLRKRNAKAHVLANMSAV